MYHFNNNNSKTSAHQDNNHLSVTYLIIYLNMPSPRRQRSRRKPNLQLCHWGSANAARRDFFSVGGGDKTISGKMTQWRQWRLIGRQSRRCPIKLDSNLFPINLFQVTCFADFLVFLWCIQMQTETNWFSYPVCYLFFRETLSYRMRIGVYWRNVVKHKHKFKRLDLHQLSIIQ